MGTKIILSAIIEPREPNTTIEHLKHLLGSLGHCDWRVAEQVETAPVTGLSNMLWLSVPLGDGLFSLVDSPGTLPRRNLLAKEVDSLRQRAVCVELAGHYPEKHVHGAPLYAADPRFAEAMAARAGFRVNPLGLVVTQRERPGRREETWLKLAGPADLFCEIYACTDGQVNETAAPRYRREFAGFPMLEFDPGVFGFTQDVSSRESAAGCPCFATEDDLYRLWWNWPKPEEREWHSPMTRFFVTQHPHDKAIFESEQIEALVKFLGEL